jgi:hypothetical protein
MKLPLGVCLRRHNWTSIGKRETTNNQQIRIMAEDLTNKKLAMIEDLAIEEEIKWQEEEDNILLGSVILLTKSNRYGTVHRPYNDLPFSGANYTLEILQGNPCCTIDVFWVTTLTFLFLCKEILAVQTKPVSKLLPLEEQLAIFLYIVGHNNSNQQAQDRFQHTGRKISK